MQGGLKARSNGTTRICNTKKKVPPIPNISDWISLNPSFRRSGFDETSNFDQIDLRRFEYLKYLKKYEEHFIRTWLFTKNVFQKKHCVSSNDKLT